MPVTFDPAYNTASITLSNGNLTLTNRTASAWHPARATSLFNSGKLYFEVTANAVSSTGAMVGIFNASAASGNYIGSDVNGVGYQMTGARLYNGVNQGSIQSWTTGAVLCVAYDLVNNKVWFRLNAGTWDNTTDNPATNTGGLPIAAFSGSGIYPAAVTYASGDQLTANFGATAFAQAVPAGFTAADSGSGGSATQATALVMA